MNLDQFYAKTARNGDCWEWTGTRTNKGYGTFSLKGKPQAAHRYSFYLAYGMLPKRLHVLHSCDNPPCVNPAHLRAGTHAENMMDKFLRGRARKTPLIMRLGKHGYAVIGTERGQTPRRKQA